MEKNENSPSQITYSVVIIVSLKSYLNIIDGEKQEYTSSNNHSVIIKLFLMIEKHEHAFVSLDPE